MFDKHDDGVVFFVQCGGDFPQATLQLPPLLSSTNRDVSSVFQQDISSFRGRLQATILLYFSCRTLFHIKICFFVHFLTDGLADFLSVTSCAHASLRVWHVVCTVLSAARKSGGELK